MVAITGDNVILDSLKTSDVLQVIEWSKNSPESFFLLNSILPITSEDLILELNSTNRLLYVLKDKKGNKIGLIRVYNINTATKRASIDFTMRPSQNNTKIIQEALEIVLQRLFEKQNITKIYNHCLKQENELKIVLTKLLFKKEGDFKEHFFWNNAYHDVEIFALAKEDYYK